MTKSPKHEQRLWLRNQRSPGSWNRQAWIHRSELSNSKISARTLFFKKITQICSFKSFMLTLKSLENSLYSSQLHSAFHIITWNMQHFFFSEKKVIIIKSHFSLRPISSALWSGRNIKENIFNLMEKERFAVRGQKAL